ncbi:MAG: hypothetical protein IAE94_08370 [Chthoniobacterales bacterium]|nr:hypothetical protein [Chthoniobacterales bacterium]
MKKLPLVAHLDLKGIQYRPEFYGEYFQNLRDLGYQAVLVEYEDVFPFRAARMSARPEEVWTGEFLRSFLELAAQAEIEVIPLQQCLGHLEYAFRQSENRRYSVPRGELRDLDAVSSEARQWMQGLLAEVMDAHPAARFVHLGMDEAGSFAAHARASGREPLDVFLEYLEELCALCERHGKKPLIWADMLEDHIAPENIERLRTFRDRVVLVPWNYAAGIKPESIVRFSGFRCSRHWLERPQDGPDGVGPIWDDLLFFEDWAPEIKALAADFQISPWLMAPLFQAAIWKRLGFTVWGGAGGSITQDRSILPYYHWRAANIRIWKQTVETHHLDGLIITQWARSNSCTVPNILPDAVWPVLAGVADAEGGVCAFFPGVERVDDLMFQIGKCREDWSLEGTLIREMDERTPSAHAYEWTTLRLLLRVLQISKRIAAAEELTGCYAGIGRLNETAWKTPPLRELRKQLLEIRPEVRKHLETRYHGQALEEWFYKVFSVPLETLDRLEATVAKSIATFNKRQTGTFFHHDDF